MKVNLMRLLSIPKNIVGSIEEQRQKKKERERARMVYCRLVQYIMEDIEVKMLAHKLVGASGFSGPYTLNIEALVSRLSDIMAEDQQRKYTPEQ